MTTLPRLGAALKHDAFALLQTWMRDHDRALEIQDFVTFQAIVHDREALLSAYKPLLDGYHGPVGIHGPFLGLDISNPDPELRAIITQRLLQGLEVAESLSGTHMVVHSPFTFWHRLNDQNYEWLRQSLFEASLECLAPVVNRARDIGCVLMLENIDDADPFMRVDLVREVGSDHLKTSIDTGHAQLANGQYKAPPVTDFIAAAGDTLGHVHLQDADGYADRHWHPGEGTLPWPAIFDAIARTGANPRLLIEPRDREHLLPQTVALLEARQIAC
ncbi:MAG: sugar phosphate isomerase/epimerase family protein [Pelagimonas sp.]|uniref:sugar phosphate isomerase/epimerase family protein n=1 Tax=Pelagimonas sp. TaxID=2073170 RepID=UPI003D6AFCF2